MNSSSRVSAIVAYVVPILGWLYVYLFQRHDKFAVYHLRQAIGLVIFLIVTFVVWAIVGFFIALIPYMAVVSITLFPLVLAAYIFGFFAWVKGLLHVWRNEMHPLPGIGVRANRLPIS